MKMTESTTPTKHHKKDKEHKKDKKDKKRKSLTVEEAQDPTEDVQMKDVDDTPKKKRKQQDETTEESTVDNYDLRMAAILPFAKPLASKKLNKKVLKTVKKAAKSKHVKRGVKEVIKSLRKGDKGLVIVAGDISPMDVISHIPVLCEDNNVPYLFVPSKEDLGSAGATKRPTSCVMVIPGGFKKSSNKSEPVEYRQSFDEIVSEIKDMQ
ncbi:L30e-like protein [Dipodascopsis uninucleata]